MKMRLFLIYNFATVVKSSSSRSHEHLSAGLLREADLALAVELRGD